MKILLTDDNAELREVLRETLVEAGHEVFLAENGEQACHLMGAVSPDILVTDVLMPERDGLEVIREFRRIYPEAFVLAMSGGSGLFEDRFCLELARQLGANVIIKKPFSFQEFVKIIEQSSPAKDSISPDSNPG